MHNEIPDSNMLDAAAFHQRIQRLLRKDCRSDDNFSLLDIGDVRLIMDRLGFRAYVGPNKVIAYTWKSSCPDNVYVSFNARLVREAMETLDRSLVLESLSDV